MNFLSTICVASIAAALFKIIVPENKFTKQMSVLIAGVFLLIVITAFAGTRPDLDISSFEEMSEDKINDFSSDVNEQLKNEVCAGMEEKIRDILSQNGIYPEQIHVIVNISGLYGIDITEIRIVLGENSSDEIRTAELLKNEISEDIKIMISKR